MAKKDQGVAFNIDGFFAAGSKLSPVGVRLYQTMQVAIKNGKKMLTIHQLAELWEVDPGQLKQQAQKQLEIMRDDLSFIRDFRIDDAGEISFSVASGFSLSQTSKPKGSLH